MGDEGINVLDHVNFYGYHYSICFGIGRLEIIIEKTYMDSNTSRDRVVLIRIGHRYIHSCWYLGKIARVILLTCLLSN